MMSIRSLKLSQDPSLSGARPNVPFHIWRHEVELAAVRHGVSSDFLRLDDTRSRLSRAYQMGEAMWMAAEMVICFARGRDHAANTPEESNRRVLRRMLAGVK